MVGLYNKVFKNGLGYWITALLAQDVCAHSLQACYGMTQRCNGFACYQGNQRIL